MELYFKEEKIGRDLNFSENFCNILVSNIAEIHEIINNDNNDGYLLISQKNDYYDKKKESNIYEFEVKYNDSLYMTIEFEETKISKIRTLYEIKTKIHIEESKSYNISYIEKEEIMHTKINEMYDFLKIKLNRFNKEYENERKLEREFGNLHILSS